MYKFIEFSFRFVSMYEYCSLLPVEQLSFVHALSLPSSHDWQNGHENNIPF